MAREIIPVSRPNSLRLSLSVFLLLSVLAAGTAGYHLIEGWPLLQSFYMTVITVSTVGFGEVGTLSDEGLVFTVLLIAFGVTAVALSISALFEYFVLRGLTSLFGRNTMDKQIQKLNGHTIVCGYGRTGFYIVRDFQRMKRSVVVVESDPDRTALLQEEGILYVQGDAADEDVLEAAGLERAESLVATLASDADNLFVTLSAHSLRHDLKIIARVEDPDNSRKFLKAGATQVVSPFSAGANRMVQLLTRPAVVDLIELVTRRENLALEVCEIAVDEKSELAHKSLAESRVRQTFGCMVFAVKRPNGDTIFDPDPSRRVEPGDVLVAIQKPHAAE